MNIYFYNTVSFGSRIGMRMLWLISDVIAFFSSTISRGIFIYICIYQMSKKEENWTEFGRNRRNDDRTKKNHLHTNPFIPPTPSRLVAPIDLVLSVLIFCLPFLRFSSYMLLAESQQCWLNLFNLFTTRENLSYFSFYYKSENSSTAILSLFSILHIFSPKMGNGN